MPLRAFAHTSVDYGGPFVTIQGSGKKREKRYLCLFTCLASRAVHLEMAYGLDTDSFLNAFFRFVNRRGVPVKMLSDRGTNFVGADKELKEIIRNLDSDNVKLKTASKGISWQFNPPYAPHWGGVHEIMIKSAKRAIYAVLKGADVNDEELLTAFSGAEALINSRPLTYQSSHPADSPPLTPNHFLFGQVAVSLHQRLSIVPIITSTKSGAESRNSFATFGSAGYVNGCQVYHPEKSGSVKIETKKSVM